jgi:metal-responsive CopG/Arc/MetJ family transcriptional regulator
MVMVAKSHKIIVRITESQLRWLTDILIKEQRTKSQILREALNQYLIEKTRRNEPTEIKFNQFNKNG